MPGHSMGTLHLRELHAEATSGVWGMLPQKILASQVDSEAILGHIVALNLEH